jgi:hypothetical protein
MAGLFDLKEVCTIDDSEKKSTGRGLSRAFRDTQWNAPNGSSGSSGTGWDGHIHDGAAVGSYCNIHADKWSVWRYSAWSLSLPVLL